MFLRAKAMPALFDPLLLGIPTTSFQLKLYSRDAQDVFSDDTPKS